MSKRERNAKIAEETLNIIERGHYTNKNGEIVFMKNELDNAIGNSIMYKPNSFKELKVQFTAKNRTMIEVKNETSLQAAERLVREGYQNIICLNFASAKKPGGGFKNGSMAQEESLAISSGLYPCIAQMKEMYDHNNYKVKSGLYSDYMIYSPDVPIFRNEKLELLEEPYLCSFITSPAVNAGIVRERESAENKRAIHSVMKRRIEKILTLAVLHESEAIVLGAYGCGVFKNEAKDVASYFQQYLINDMRFKKYFQKITFAILDNTQNNNIIRTFKKGLNVR